MATAIFFLVCKNSEMIRLNKGISQTEVINLLGTEFTIEGCSGMHNQKWLYAFSGSTVIYKLFFRNKELEWAMKGTNFIQKETAGTSGNLKTERNIKRLDYSKRR